MQLLKCGIPKVRLLLLLNRSNLFFYKLSLAYALSNKVEVNQSKLDKSALIVEVCLVNVSEDPHGSGLAYEYVIVASLFSTCCH